MDISKRSIRKGTQLQSRRRHNYSFIKNNSMFDMNNTPITTSL